jgi:hypothetical protein
MIQRQSTQHIMSVDPRSTLECGRLPAKTPASVMHASPKLS